MKNHESHARPDLELAALVDGTVWGITVRNGAKPGALVEHYEKRITFSSAASWGMLYDAIDAIRENPPREQDDERDDVIDSAPKPADSQHARQDRQGPPVKCPQCGKVYRVGACLGNHLRLKHGLTVDQVGAVGPQIWAEAKKRDPGSAAGES